MSQDVSPRLELGKAKLEMPLFEGELTSIATEGAADCVVGIQVNGDSAHEYRELLVPANFSTELGGLYMRRVRATLIIEEVA